MSLPLRFAFVAWSLLSVSAALAADESLTAPDRGVAYLGKNPVIAWPASGSGVVAWSEEMPDKLRVLKTTGELNSTLALPKTVTKLRWLSVRPDWSILAISDQGELVRWYRSEKFQPKVSDLQASLKPPCAVTADGARLLCESSSGLTLVDTTSFEATPVDGLGGLEVMSLGAYTSGIALVVSEKAAQFIRMEDGSLLGDPVQLEANVEQVFESPSRRYLAALSGERIEVFDLQHGEHEYLDRNSATAIRFAGSGDRYLISFGKEEYETRTEVWNLGERLDDFRFERSIEDRETGPVAGSRNTSDLLYLARLDHSFVEVSLEDASRKQWPRYRLEDHENENRVHDLVRTDSGALAFASVGARSLALFQLSVPLRDYFQESTGFRPRDAKRSSSEHEIPMMIWIEEFDTPVEKIECLRGNSGAVVRCKQGKAYFISLASIPAIQASLIKYGSYNPKASTIGGPKIQYLDTSPDGRFAASIVDSGISLVDLKTATELEYTRSTGLLTADFDQSSRRLLVTSSSGTRLVPLQRPLALSNQIQPWTPGSKSSEKSRLAHGIRLEGKLAVLDTDSGAVIAKVDFDYLSGNPLMSISPDGSSMAAVGGIARGNGLGLQVLDLPSGKNRNSMSIDAPSLTGVHLTADNQKAIVGTGDGARIVDLRRRRVEEITLPDRKKNAAKKELATVSGATMQSALDSVYYRPPPKFYAFATSNDEKLVAVAGFHTLAIFSLETRELIRQVDLPFKPISLQFSSDRQQLVISMEGGMLLVVALEKLL